MSEWRPVTLKEAVLKANTGADAIKRAPIVDYDTGIRCIRIQDLSNDHSFQQWGFCETTPENYKRFALKKGDLLIARTGNTIGVNRYIFSDQLAVFNNGLIRLKVNTEICISKYIYYLFQTYQFKGHIKSIAYGTSTQPNMQIESLLRFQFKLPPIEIQEQIVKIFSVLDLKIENLRRQNETLEEIAQTLFKHWFVDFEFPYDFAQGKPNADGKPYKSSGGEMVPSELGEIPAGWRVGTFDEFFDLFSGGTPKTSVGEYWNGDVKWLSGKDVTSHHKSFILDTEKTISAVGLDNSAAKLLPQHTMIISARGTVGNYCILSEKMAISQSNFGVLAKQKEHIFFGHLLISSLIDRLKREAYGSVFDTITTSNFRRLSILTPPLELVNEFEEIISKLFRKILLNSEKNQTLTKTRDVLLPKLMSGQIRIT
jgi:type I restriction enzyme S subunit